MERRTDAPKTLQPTVRNKNKEISIRGVVIHITMESQKHLQEIVHSFKGETGIKRLSKILLLHDLKQFT